MEITANAVQTVASNQNILFTNTPVAGGKCIVHRDGSGIITLRGLTNQNNARFLLTYNANIAIPTGGAVGAISTAISISGEPLASTETIVTPAAVENYFNVSSSAYINVPKGCCSFVSVENTSSEAIEVQNANLIVTRVA